MSAASTAVSQRGSSSGLSDAEENVTTFNQYYGRNHKQAIEHRR
jgi:hypothetical protein